MRFEQIGFVPKRVVPQGRAGAYLKEINSIAMFSLTDVDGTCFT